MVETIKRGFKKAASSYWALVKIIIPVYIIVTFIKYTGGIDYLAQFFSPLMTLVGLPGEAVLALLTGYLLNIYGALAVIASLDLQLREITILGTMLGIAHSLIIEAAVLKKINGRVGVLVGLRILLSVLAGVSLNLFL